MLYGPITECQGTSQDGQSSPSRCEPQNHFQRCIRSSFRIAPASLDPPDMSHASFWALFRAVLHPLMGYAVLWYSKMVWFLRALVSLCHWERLPNLRLSMRVTQWLENAVLGAAVLHKAALDKPRAGPRQTLQTQVHFHLALMPQEYFPSVFLPLSPGLAALPLFC